MLSSLIHKTALTSKWSPILASHFSLSFGVGIHRLKNFVMCFLPALPCLFFILTFFFFPYAGGLALCRWDLISRWIPRRWQSFEKQRDATSPSYGISKTQSRKPASPPQPEDRVHLWSNYKTITLIVSLRKLIIMGEKKVSEMKDAKLILFPLDYFWLAEEGEKL